MIFYNMATRMRDDTKTKAEALDLRLPAERRLQMVPEVTRLSSGEFV
jgi:hypothetical protein